MYDYLLGGDHNFEVDREFARGLLEKVPEAPEVALLNKKFLRRGVEHCLREGIRQFLDLGSGIPTAGVVGNVHEIAWEHDPSCRVVYVDREPVAFAYGRAILEGEERAAMVSADLTDPDEVLALPEVRRLIDFDRPVCLLMLGVLHYVHDDDDPAGLVARYRDVLAPGSHLLVTHGTEGDNPVVLRSAIAMSKDTDTPAYMRTAEEVTEFFAGFELLDPGVVCTPDWRPDSTGPDSARPFSETARRLAVAGVGRKPAVR
jgi:SAM-dependent methyltransferase